MINSIFRFFIIIYFCINNLAFSNSFVLESKNIEITDKGNQIIAIDGTAISDDKNLKIRSNKIIYLKSKNLLTSFGNGEALLKSEKIKIKFDKAFFDEKKNQITTQGNVEILQTNNNFLIINEEINFNRRDNILSSNQTTKILDYKSDTYYYVDSFVFEINKDLIKVKNLIAIDNQKNTYKTSIAFINTKSGKIFGKDISMRLGDPNISTKNNFRFKGNSANINNKSTIIQKGIFTSCKENETCPPWSFSAKKIKHDKIKKEINYEDAVLKIYNKPILYFPRFFHPDPTVERKTGFLIPSIKNSSNSGNFLNLPFFYAPTDNKDFTFSPRLYASEKILLQTEYRQKNINSNHFLDFSLLNEKNNNSKNHLFYKYSNEQNIMNFDNSLINLIIQQTSSDSYLKSNNIESDLINDSDILENSLSLDLYSNNLSINLNASVYENTNKIGSDRYEYIFPRAIFKKDFNEIDNSYGYFSLESEALVRQYDTNITEKININNFIFNSNRKFNKFGLLNTHTFLIKNSNSDNHNTDYKNNKTFYLSGIYQYNSSLPLIKENNKYRNILKPQFSFKAAPNHTKNERNVERKIDLNNIYSVDRISNNSHTEGGLSLTYGLDYSVNDKLNTHNLLDLKLANNFRFKKNKDLPKTHQIGENISNVFSEITVNPNKHFSLKYIAAIKNDLQNLEYENAKTTFLINNFKTEFDYLNENNTVNKNSYLTNSTNFKINDFNNLQFSTRKNKTKDLTEYYKMMYQYKNDCLAASIEYNKNFYNDEGLKPEKSLLFKLTIIPFAEISTANLNQ